MGHAVSFALIDSVNLLLIGVIVAVGVMLPKGAKFPKIAALLLLGDWLGVFLLALVTMFIFGGIEDSVAALLESPVFGMILIAIGLLGAFLTWRGGDSSALVGRLLAPLRTPTIKTLITGVVLGVAQTVVSLPFFAGIAYLSVGGYSTVIRYVGMFFYASLALSLPTLCAILVGFVRKYPYSPAGRGFEWMRKNSEKASALAGYLVAAMLILLGVLHL